MRRISYDEYPSTFSKIDSEVISTFYWEKRYSKDSKGCLKTTFCVLGNGKRAGLFGNLMILNTMRAMKGVQSIET